MGTLLPELEREDFERRLAALGCALPDLTLERLFHHYQLLRRWNRVHALVGPASEGEVVERHYGDSLRALPLLAALPPGSRLLDVGSGAGFPGFVLAAARPDLEVTLLEPRQKKAAFLRLVGRATGVTFEVVTGRIGARLPEGLPEQIDCVTLRALKLDAEAWQLLLPRLGPEARVLLWAGRSLPELPSGLRLLDEHRGDTDTGILAVLVAERPSTHESPRPA